MANVSDSNHSRFWQRIQGKLILLLLTLLLPILFIQAYVYHERLKTRRAEELQSNLELARAAAQAFEAFVNDIIHQELSIGLALTSSQSLTEEDQNRILNGSKRGNSAIWEIFWSQPDGIVTAATGPQFIGITFEDRDYFREIVSGREWTVSDLLLSRTTGRPSFTISRGIRSDTGQLLGIVVAGILPEQLDHILAIKRSEGGGHALVDRKGMLVYRYPAINHPTWEQRNWLRDYPEFGVALNGNEISKTVFASFEGKNRLVSFAPVSFVGWAASAGRTEDIAMEAITSRLIPEAVLFLLFTLAAFGVALVLSRFISMPVKRLRDHALSLGRGEANDPAAATGPAELRELADAFNSMAEQLRSRETSLRDQREWLSVTLTSIGDAVMATDTEGRVIFLNPTAAVLTGWQIEEAVGQPVQNIFQVINELTRQPAEDIVSRVLREGRMVALANHTTLITRDDRELAIEDSAAPIRDGTGNLIGVVLVFHDVTEKRRMQGSLRESEEQFRALADSIPNLAWRANGDGYITWYNQRWHEYTGTTPAQMEGWGWQSVHDPVELPKVLERWQASIATGEPFEMTFPLRGADGIFRPFLTRIIPLKDAAGRVHRWFGTNTDVSELKRVEEERARLLLEVQNQAAELDATLSSMVIGLIVYDTAGKAIRLNNTAKKLLPSELFFNMTVEERLHVLRWETENGQPFPPEEIPVVRALRGETTNDVVLAGLFPNRTLWILASAAPIRTAEGKMIGAVATFIDITASRQAEERIKATLAEKEVLLKEIHHRVKNNLQVISSLVALQADGLQDGAMRAVLQDVTHRVRSMAIVHEKLYQSADLARVDFAEYARSLLNYLWHAYGTEASGIRLALDLEPVTLSVDAAVPCGLILNELLSNTLKHAFSGRDNGEVAVSLRESTQEKVRLCVRDNGMGLPAGFDWRQAGTLGMRLVYMLAGQLHAAVEVSSGEGTEFTLTFERPKT
jgi:PAS domain S-box-containing protein